jgi:hypothetical protein
MNAVVQRMNCGYRLVAWLTQWRREEESESKTYLWSALRGRYTRNESEASGERSKESILFGCSLFIRRGLLLMSRFAPFALIHPSNG